ncbi:hypothetical protein DPMN_149463 [Dreissena polymorpha]|uniref:Uncharacterized protein n=1 Tax=Dreissena polymorpha TaxID=45954 RepID=A0A9D4FDK7_DREPO|nr:hypothetical protein DPMN_149463 [Dreissena polymorpha]
MHKIPVERWHVGYVHCWPDDSLTTGRHVDGVDVEGLQGVFDQAHVHQGLLGQELLVLDQARVLQLCTIQHTHMGHQSLFWTRLLSFNSVQYNTCMGHQSYGPCLGSGPGLCPSTLYNTTHTWDTNHMGLVWGNLGLLHVPKVSSQGQEFPPKLEIPLEGTFQ